MDDLHAMLSSDAQQAEPLSSANVKSKGKPKTFNCSACGGTVIIKAVGITIEAVCNQCSSIIDVTNENYEIIAQANVRNRAILLEIGTRGQLRGVDWEVVGYMEKTDGSGMYRWEEYLLYNPYQGFRFLVQSAGHWNLVKVVKQDIPDAGLTNEVWFADRKFSIFLRGESVVEYVKGEFYWRVKKGELTIVADYIAPPYMLSIERNKQEFHVSLGEYIDADEVQRAFNIKPNMPYQKGVGANQPKLYHGKMGNVMFVAFVAFLCVCIIQVMTVAAADDLEVYAFQELVQPSQKDNTISSVAFNVPKEGNILIKSTSPVENNWVELGVSLVNEQTNEAYEVKQAIEYYRGYDGGESWSEGEQYAETYISNVPSGNYRLLFDVDAGEFPKGTPVNLSLNVKNDVPNWSNLWIILGLIMTYPLFMVLRHWNFEAKRWSESDCAPTIYRSNQGGDDD